MIAYGIRLAVPEGIARYNAVYMSLSGTWKPNVDTPMVFKQEWDAEVEAFNLVASDSSYFGRISVVKLFPTVSQWILERDA